MSVECEAEYDVRISDCADITECASRLGCVVPTTFALLPSNYASASSIDELEYPESTVTVRKLLRSKALSESPFEPPDAEVACIHQRDATWIAPTLFFAATCISDNPELLKVAIEVIADYATEWFRGTFGRRHVRMTIVIETGKRKATKRIDFDGPADSMSNLIDIIKNTVDDES